MSGSDGAHPRRIEDYALIGSTETAALVHRNGTIEWLCLPDFDSPAVFAALLGTPDHGAWSVRSTDPHARIDRRYVPDTLILETTITTETGTAVLTDFMPKPLAGGSHELIRMLRGVTGYVDIEMDLRLRFEYGARMPWVERKTGTVVAIAGPHAVRLSGSVEFSNADFATRARIHLAEGQEHWMMLDYFPSHLDLPPPRDPHALLAGTRSAWQAWIGRCTYEGPYADAVRRSLITLKALTYAPTGGIVAAPTTSLPEMPGGVRNWDYRYCWIRDAVHTLYALNGSGFQEEASAWRWWLMRAAAGAPRDIQIMYGLRGERDLAERELDLPGFEASRPVRVGNAAHQQRQLDIYGALLGAFDAARRAGLADMDAVWGLQCAVADDLLTVWMEPDSGLWEVRGPPRHFVYSKVMCWFAFDRMVASAEDFGLSGNIDAWRAARDAIHADICEKGFDTASNSFVQSYGSKAVDAALLQIPILGFLPADDPRVIGTTRRIEEELLRNGVVYRYRSADTDESDGLPGHEGAFLACGFWLSHVRALSGRMDEAKSLFEQLLSLSNDLGLLSEEYDPQNGRMLGNFPQAFSHFALVNCAHAFTRQPGSAAQHLVVSPQRSL